MDQENLKLPFMKDFQPQMDEYLHYSLPAFLVHKSSVFENCQYLLGFKDVTLQLSELIGVDLSENVSGHLESLHESVDTLSFYLRQMSDRLLERGGLPDIKYQLQTFMPNPSLVLNGLKSRQNEGLEIFNEKLRDLIL